MSGVWSSLDRYTDSLYGFCYLSLWKDVKRKMMMVHVHQSETKLECCNTSEIYLGFNLFRVSILVGICL